MGRPLCNRARRLSKADVTPILLPAVAGLLVGCLLCWLGAALHKPALLLILLLVPELLLCILAAMAGHCQSQQHHAWLHDGSPDTGDASKCCTGSGILLAFSAAVLAGCTRRVGCWRARLNA